MVNLFYPNTTPGYHSPTGRRDTAPQSGGRGLADERRPASIGSIGVAIVATLFLAALVFALLSYAFNVDRSAGGPETAGQSVHPKDQVTIPVPALGENR